MSNFNFAEYFNATKPTASEVGDHIGFFFASAILSMLILGNFSLFLAMTVFVFLALFNIRLGSLRSGILVTVSVITTYCFSDYIVRPFVKGYYNYHDRELIYMIYTLF